MNNIDKIGYFKDPDQWFSWIWIRITGMYRTGSGYETLGMPAPFPNLLRTLLYILYSVQCIPVMTAVLYSVWHLIYRSESCWAVIQRYPTGDYTVYSIYLFESYPAPCLFMGTSFAYPSYHLAPYRRYPARDFTVLYTLYLSIWIISCSLSLHGNLLRLYPYPSLPPVPYMTFSLALQETEPCFACKNTVVLNSITRGNLPPSLSSLPPLALWASP